MKWRGAPGGARGQETNSPAAEGFCPLREACLASSFTNRAVPGDRRRANFARPFTNIELCVPDRVRLFYCLRGCACGWSAGDLLYEGEEKVRESPAGLSPIDLLSYADGGQEASGTGLLSASRAGIRNEQKPKNHPEPPCFLAQ